MPLKFEAALLPALGLTVDKSDVDVDARRLRFKTSRPAKKARVTVLMDTGKVAFDDEVIFDATDASRPLEVGWPEAPGRVLKIVLRAQDAQSFFTGMELFPWRVDIPHEEVNFDTGKWDVRPGERAKLDASFGLIADAVRKYGHLADIKLYVAGHTDTVGGTDSNRTLSLNRARSIGAYLKKRGLRAPIFYDGLGEEALLVPTADEKDEAKNRRAEYIVAVEPPEVQNARVQPSWRKL